MVGLLPPSKIGMLYSHRSVVGDVIWQKLTMRTICFTAILWTVSIGLAGCRIASNAPHPQWLADFQRADSVRVQKNDTHVTLTDSQTIERLRTIYATAKWKRYWHTLPGDLGEQTIELLDGETVLRRFSYAGDLWETASYTENRTTELTATDRQWIESLFDIVPNPDTSNWPNASSRLDEFK